MWQTSTAGTMPTPGLPCTYAPSPLRSSFVGAPRCQTLRPFLWLKKKRILLFDSPLFRPPLRRRRSSSPSFPTDCVVRVCVCVCDVVTSPLPVRVRSRPDELRHVECCSRSCFNVVVDVHVIRTDGRDVHVLVDVRTSCVLVDDLFASASDFAECIRRYRDSR